MRRLAGTTSTLALAALIMTSAPSAPAAVQAPTATTSVSAALRPYYAQLLVWEPCHKTLQCATFRVPLDYAKPSGRRLTITAARVPATGTSRGSLVVNPGGPGSSGIEYISDPQYAVSATARRNFDLVSFDPRGVGESAPLWCLDGTRLDSFLDLDPTPDTAREQQALLASGRVLAAACTREDAALMEHVSAVDMARDMDILRAVLGEARLRYLGKSWGTVLGKVYAALFPSRVGSFVLDGAVDLALPATRATFEQARGFETAIDRFVAWCVKRNACVLGENVVSAKQRLVRFVQSLDAKPLPAAESTRPLTEAQAVTAIIGPLYVADGGFEWLLSGLTPALQSGDGTALQTIFDWFVERDGNGRYANNANTAIYVVNCLDGRAGISTIAQARATATAWAAKLPFMGRVMAWSDLPCAEWPVRASTDITTLQVRNVPPALVLGGTYDPATPLAWSRGLAAQWPTSALLVHDGDGHTSYANGSLCVDRYVDTFLLSADIRHPDLPANGTMCDATIG